MEQASLSSLGSKCSFLVILAAKLLLIALIITVLTYGINDGCGDHSENEDGSWSPWSAAGSCTATCGEGFQLFLRNCTDPVNPHEKMANCKGDPVKLEPCGTNACPAWSDDGSCGATCGVGFRRQSRTYSNPPPQGAGAPCPGAVSQLVPCGSDVCPVDGGWTEWADSSSCSSTCGNGTKEQVRYCANPPTQGNGTACAGPSLQTAPCENGECVTSVDGGWTDWTEIGACSATCGHGTKNIVRFCANPVPRGFGNMCSGMSEQNGSCNIRQCPISVNGAWTIWSDTSLCSVSCGEGTKHQVRYCASPAPQGSGKNCTGPSQNNTTCNLGPCSATVDGAWTEWYNATACSATCGNGTKVQKRFCTNPAPQGKGTNCDGFSEQTTLCSDGACPPPKVDGGWTQWNDSSECSATCGLGTKTQERFCTNPAPQGSGASCSGPSQQTESCSTDICPSVSCPRSHPFNYSHNDCCQHHISVNNASIHDTCDGTELDSNSDPSCCPLGRSVRCSETDLGCHRHDSAPQLSCSAMPKIISEESHHGLSYTAVNVFSDDTCHYYITWPDARANYWVGPTETATAQFTIDYGCIIEITRFELRNTNNYQYNIAATHAFRIETSVDNVAFNIVVSGSLISPFNIDDCEIPLEIFEPQTGSTAKGRYVKFQAYKMHGLAAGLMHFRARYINQGVARCTDEFQIVHADPAAVSMQTPVWQIFTDDGCDENYFDASPDTWPNYWLLPDGDPGGKGFVMDFGCNIDIEGFELRNTKNSNGRDRIDVSENMADWTTALSGELPNATQYANCGEIPLTKFRPEDGIVRGRFIRFNALGYYGAGAGLHYFNVVQHDKREGYNCNPYMKVLETSEHSEYPLLNMFTNACQESGNMWLLPDNMTDGGFTLDYGCELFLTKFELKNANMPSSNNRGTKNFEIQVSKDNAKWTSVVDGILPNVSGLNCAEHQALPFFPSTGPSYARFIRFRALSYYGIGAGLQYFHAAFRGLEVSKAHCPSNVVMEGDFSGPGYEPSNVILDACEQDSPSPNYWAGPERTIHPSFILDFGCPILMTKFQIKNSKVPNGNRGTNEFTINISIDHVEWNQVVSSSLADVMEMECDAVPMEEFAPNEGVAIGRYVKFTMKTYHGIGGGLRYFNVIHRDHDTYCPMHPIIDAATDAPFFFANGAAFRAENILHDKCEQLPGNYWHSTGDTSNVNIILDYGCHIRIARVQIKNGNNIVHQGKRGTAHFTVDVSKNKQSWTEIVSDTLPDPSYYPNCESVPLHEYDVAPGTTARFVRINLKTYYGVGSVLRYFNIIKDGNEALTPPAVLKGDKSIVWETRPFDNRHMAQNTLEGQACEEGAVWITPNWSPGSFVLDMGAEVFVKHYVIINSAHTHATKHFKVEASQDMANWVTSVPEGELPHPGQSTNVDHVREGRGQKWPL